MSAPDRLKLHLPLSEATPGPTAEARPAAPEAARVVVVTPDPGIGPVLLGPLSEAGYDTALAREGRAALTLLKEPPAPSLILVDLSLPDMSASEFFAALKKGRELRNAPVVVITARNTETDRVVAFELGADDFVGAPFSVREVLLRIRVQLRSRVLPANSSGLLEIGILKLDRDAHRVWVEGREISLSVREFKLLQVLLERSERVLSRHTLLDLVWGRAAHVGVRAVDAYVTRLRKKLGPAREYVETLSAVGYRLKRPLG